MREVFASDRTCLLSVGRVVAVLSEAQQQNEESSMSRVLYGVLALVLALAMTGQAMAQTPETEPNDAITDTGVITITQIGVYTGTLTTNDDDDFWLINAGSSGNLDITFNVDQAGHDASLTVFSGATRDDFSTTVTTVTEGNPVATTVPLSTGLFYSLRVRETTIGTEDYQIVLSGDASLPVNLSAFTAKYDNGQAEIYWRTEYEENNLGFNVYRSTSKDGQYARVNTALIKGNGNDSTTHEYSIVDDQVTEGQTYWYVVEDVDFSGTANRSKPIKLAFGEPLPVQKQLPARFALLPNYPNPFNPETWFPYELAEDAPVTFRVFNSRGQLVRQMSLGQQAAGIYVEKGQATYWDGRDANGQEVSSGIYFYQLQAGDFSAMRRMVILR